MAPNHESSKAVHFASASSTIIVLLLVITDNLLWPVYKLCFLIGIYRQNQHSLYQVQCNL